MHMNIYMAAVYTNGYMKDQQRYSKLEEYEKSVVSHIPHMLESYHYINKQKIVDIIREQGTKVFLDSGAFSAWNANVTINLKAYCEYIKKNWDLWRWEDNAVLCSVLDGIGDPQLTYENQLAMEREGIRPLPCFHFGEDERYLEFYMKNYEYITIGGMVGKSTKSLVNWLDKIWGKYLLDGTGKPKLKVHAFGITSFEIMQRYPWFSCDSSSWIQAAAFGNIITEQWGIMCISSKSMRKHQQGAHILNHTTPETQTISNYVGSHGFNLKRLGDIYESRAVFNLNSFKAINKKVNNITPTMFEGYVIGLF